MSTYEVYCKHSFIIDGIKYSYDEAKDLLEKMDVRDRVVIEHNGKKYVVERTIPKHIWWSRSPMYEIRAVTPVGEVFVIRRDYSFDVLIDLITNIRHHDGYVKIYGKYEHPLDEFRDELEDFTCLDRVQDKPYWTFCGNHKKYSAAFRYAIYDEKLVKEVAERMKEQQLGNIGL